MRKNINKEKIEGYLFSHDLELKTVKNEQSANFGKEFIKGKIYIATDEQLLNVIPVEYTYVTAITSKGVNNKTFNVLKKIIDGAPTVQTHGKDAALKVSATPTLALNDYYDSARDNQLVSLKVNSGGFIDIVNQLCDESERSYFETDMLINGVRHVDADPEKDIAEHAIIKGAIFDFRNTILPLEFKIENPDGMAYFEGLEASQTNMIYTKVWGKIVCTTKDIKRTEESAFGEPAVKTVKRNVRDWLITGGLRTPYDFGDENVMTVDELKTALANREIYLAEVKARKDEWEANKTATVAAPSGPAAVKVNPGAFNF